MTGTPLPSSTTARDQPTMPIDGAADIERIRALNTVDEYGFDVETKARIFGVSPSAIKTVDDLPGIVYMLAVHCRSLDVWSRINDINEIRQALDARFGSDNIEAHRQWLKSHCPLPENTCWTMLGTAGIAELGQVALFATRKTH